jgi:hypothetical protein
MCSLMAVISMRWNLERSISKCSISFLIKIALPQPSRSSLSDLYTLQLQHSNFASETENRLNNI